MLAKQSGFKQELLFCLLVSVAIAAIYGQSFNYEFTNFDDPFYVTKNSYVQKGLTVEGFKWAFSFHKKEGSYWHPLTWLSHMTDVTLFGNQPGYHHLMNIFWHILNTCLLFLFLHRTTMMFWPSALAAFVFAVHPMNVETVAWISERKNLLSTFFWIISLIAYVYYAKRPNLLKYLLLILIFIAGLMAKPMLITLPFVFLLLDYWPLERIAIGSPSLKNKPFFPKEYSKQISLLLLEKIPFIIIAVLTVYMATESVSTYNNVVSLSAIPLLLRVENLLVSYATYIGKILWPFHLTNYYPYPNSLPLLLVATTTFILGSISLAVFWPLREKKYFTVGWLWFLGTLIPVSGLLQVGLWPALADRWVYVPGIGLFVMISWGIHTYIYRRNTHPELVTAATVLVILALGTISWHQVRHWKNSLTLFTHTLEINPKNFFAHFSLGNALVEKGLIDEGVRHLKKAVSIKPLYWPALNDLGNALAQQNNPDKALNYYHQAIKNNPDSYMTYVNLGITLTVLNRLDEAIVNFKKALTLRPDSHEAHLNLANAYVKTASPDRAIPHFRKALKIHPEEFPFYNFANALKKDGQLNEAITYYKRAVEQNPNDEKIHYNLSLVLADVGKYNDAILSLKKALGFKPDYVEAHNQLANIYVRLQKTELAINHYLKAIKADPDGKISLINLADIYAKQNNHQKAADYFTQYLRLKPNENNIHFKLAQELTLLGRLEDARQQYLKVLPGTPNYFESLNNAGLLSARLNNHESAMEYFKKALTIKPDNAEIHYNIGYSYAAIGRTEDAKKSYIEALEINPDLINAHNNLGVLYAQDNQTDLAREHFEKALQIDNSSVDGHINLGVLFFKLGKKQEAAYHLQQAKYLSPNHPFLKQILQ